jgi:hypothetical protein
MGLTAKKETKAKIQRDLPKKGPRVAILTGLIDVGVHVREYMGEAKPPAREFIPIFTLMSDTYTTEEGETFNMVTSPFFPVKLMEGATRGHYFDLVNALDPENETLVDDERDLTKLLGKACFVKIKHSEPTEEGIVYANFDGVQELPEDYPVPELDKEFTVFDTENPDKEVFDSLWDRTQDQIRTSQGYAGSRLEGICEGSLVSEKKSPVEDPTDDDIPF